MPETYGEEAVQQILRLAMMKQGKEGPLPRSHLIEIAEELGISPSNLEAAEEEWQLQQEEQQAREEFAAYRHHQLRQGIVRYIIINSSLVLLNLITAHKIDWSVYPVLIWGMAITLQAWQVFQSDGEDYDRAFRRWRLRQQIGQSFKALSERFSLSWSVSPPSPDATRDAEVPKPPPSPAEQTSVTQEPLSGSAGSPNHNLNSKSLKQNRIGQRRLNQNPLKHHSSGLFTAGSLKDREHDGADRLP